MSSGNPGQWIFNAENQINLLGTSSGTETPTTATADVIAFLPDITLTLCQRINQELGLPTGTIPEESGVDLSTQMTDSTNGICNAGCGGTIGVTPNTLDGQPFGCMQQPNGTYNYYHVLVER